MSSGDKSSTLINYAEENGIPDFLMRVPLDYLYRKARPLRLYD